MQKPVRWGILGAANFARRFMGPAIHAANGAQLAALATSSPHKAQWFQDFCPGLTIYDNYDALLDDPSIDVIYVPLPNHLHVEWSLKALDAGKHVLCEKPMTMQAAEFDQLIAKRDETGLLDLPLPNLLGPHQIMNAGAAIAALRYLGKDEAACEAAVTRAYWPARMEKLTTGALVDLAAPAELWLDGGHNPAAGHALAATLKQQTPRPTHLICGMLNTKDIGGYLAPLADVAQSLTAVSIPGEQNTIPAEQTAAAAQSVGLNASVATDVAAAISKITHDAPNARILICGSLYLAGHVMRENGR